MHAITTGALRTEAWAPTAEHFFTTGFKPLTTDPVLAGRFVIIDLHDVTPGPFYGYHWQLHLTIAVATRAFGPYEASRDRTEGVAALASCPMHWADSYAAVQRQALNALSWAVNKMPEVGMSFELRARNQIAQAEYYRAKAEDARQGVADRLWRDRLLDDLSPQARASVAEWVHEFGERPMPLAREHSLHEMALMRWGLLAD